MKRYVVFVADVVMYFFIAMLVGMVVKEITDTNVSIILFAAGSTVGWVLFKFIRNMIQIIILREKKNRLKNDD